MTQAADNFRKAIHDAEVILKLIDDEKTKKTEDLRVDLDVMKRAGLILALTAWETYVKDCVREKIEFMLAGLGTSPVACIVREQMEVDLRHFNTPDTGKTRKIFKDYVRKDVTVNWKLTQTDLDKWIELRGEAAHRAPKKVDENGVISPHLISRDKLEKVINGLKKLVEATETELAKPAAN
jgi:hypothetical protein